MSLKKIQNDFSNHIFNRKNNKIINSLPYSSQEALARLNIYRNNIFGNFLSVLSSTFEVSKKIIGEKKFRKLVEEYQKKYPSKSGNLNDYCDNFPKILKKVKPAFIFDLSKLELALHKAYYSGDVKDFSINNFHKINPEKFCNLTFSLHPSCFLIKSEFPIFTIFNKKKKLLKKQAEFVLIDRALGICQARALTILEFLFLENLKKKKTLFQAYKNIIKITKKEFDIGSMLSKFINWKVICDFQILK
jgi:hypothetical protein